jgi:toxin-antitoxin system, antitoxin component, xre family
MVYCGYKNNINGGRNMELKKGFKDVLKNLRIEKGLLQKEVAEKLDISLSAYSKYEQGISTPTLENLYKIGNFFDVKINTFLNLSENEEEKKLKEKIEVLQKRIESLNNKKEQSIENYLDVLVYFLDFKFSYEKINNEFYFNFKDKKYKLEEEYVNNVIKIIKNDITLNIRKYFDIITDIKKKHTLFMPRKEK